MPDSGCSSYSITAVPDRLTINDHWQGYDHLALQVNRKGKSNEDIAYDMLWFGVAYHSEQARAASEASEQFAVACANVACIRLCCVGP